MSIFNATLTTGNAAPIYTSTGNTVVATVYFCNISGTDVEINVYAVPTGGSAAATNQIYKNFLIATDDTYVMDTEKFIFGNGDFLAANSNVATSVTSTVTYTGA